MADTDTVRVTCSDCRKRSELMAPPADHEGPVTWVCPQQKENGDLCGAQNTLEV